MIEIVPATADHIAPIASRMRLEDQREVWLLGWKFPREALEISLRCSPQAWTVFIDGNPEAMFGVGSGSGLLKTRGELWLLGTPALDGVKLSVARTAKLLVGALLEEYEVLENWVHQFNCPSVRLLRCLGATFSPPEDHGVTCAPFIHFEIRRKTPCAA